MGNRHIMPCKESLGIGKGIRVRNYGGWGRGNGCLIRIRRDRTGMERRHKISLPWQEERGDWGGQSLSLKGTEYLGDKKDQQNNK